MNRPAPAPAPRCGICRAPATRRVYWAHGKAVAYRCTLHERTLAELTGIVGSEELEKVARR